MRRVLWTALTLLSVLAFATCARLRVDTFQTDLILGEDGLLDVVERITVTFETPHHGIERWIPVEYRVPSTGTTRSIVIREIEVLVDDSAVPVTSQRRGRERYLRIGDPDRTITGTHTYEIAYTVERALLFHDEYIQVYWNVTGNDWRVPIGVARAQIGLPRAVDPNAVSIVSYVGYAGTTARGEGATRTPDGRWTLDAGPLQPGEGITVDLALPRDALPLSPPTLIRQIGWFLSDNLAAGLPLLTLLVMLALWWRLGRDPRTRAIAPVFAPPRDMHPGIAGVLVDDRVDIRDITAMIVGLAVGGHLRIEEVDEDGDTGGARGGAGLPLDFRFVRARRPLDGGLSSAEQEVLQALFGEEENEVLLSSLESRFSQHLPAIKSRLYAELIDRGDYAGNPERTRSLYRGLSLVPVAIGATVIFYGHALFLGLMIGLCGLVVLAFSPIMPRKTRQGVRQLEIVLGLARYIRLAEVDRLEFHNAPEKTPETFERMLPYAIALNLTKIWTRPFEGLLDEPPSWYVGRSPTFRGHLFALSLWHLSSGMNRTLVSAPRTAPSGKSAWSGGSSFGGGFSGGGFGGGGGGGW